jgi:hypothetical protein
VVRFEERAGFEAGLAVLNGFTSAKGMCPIVSHSVTTLLLHDRQELAPLEEARVSFIGASRRR